MLVVVALVGLRVDVALMVPGVLIVIRDMVVRMLVARVVVPCVWPTSAAGSSFMPHFGHLSGLSLTTSGCIGQT